LLFVGRIAENCNFSFVSLISDSIAANAFVDRWRTIFVGIFFAVGAGHFHDVERSEEDGLKGGR